MFVKIWKLYKLSNHLIIMRKFYTIITILSIGIFAFTSCGTATGVRTSQTANDANVNTSSNNEGTSILGALIGGISNNSENTESSLNSESLISGIIGQLTNGKTDEKSIVGTWVYAEPTIQFESENFLSQAGGAVAAKAIIQKIQPYYERMGITAGVFSITFNNDKTCSYEIGGGNYTGTYEFDIQNNTLTINSSMGFKLITTYVTVANKNLAITFDATKFLELAQSFGANSTNPTISGLTSLSKSINGMKTGFLFNKK